MKTAKISLNSIDKVKAFVNEISKFDCDFDLVSGRYVIDALSWVSSAWIYPNRSTSISMLTELLLTALWKSSTNIQLNN